MPTTDRECDAAVPVGVGMRELEDPELMAKRILALESELSTALRVIDHVAPRPWQANLDDPHDEQDSGEFDDGEWVITDASEREIDRSSAGTSWADGVTNGSWSREYVADVNALGSMVSREPDPSTGRTARLEAEIVTLRAILASVPQPEEDET